MDVWRVWMCGECGCVASVDVWFEGIKFNATGKVLKRCIDFAKNSGASLGYLCVCLVLWQRHAKLLCIVLRTSLSGPVNN